MCMNKHLCCFQGPPGDFGPKGIRGPKGPQGAMVSRPMIHTTLLMKCSEAHLFTVSLHQGRGGVSGPMGIIGPNGSAVRIITDITEHFSHSYLHTTDCVRYFTGSQRREGQSWRDCKFLLHVFFLSFLHFVYIVHCENI